MDVNKYRASDISFLNKIPTKELIIDAKKGLKVLRKKISKLQDTMYAEGKRSFLICIQGMDTAGKDSLIREVFKDVNARGVIVHSFKVPTQKELKHDFLWRHYIALPERGKIGVFNRTHYENVLVTRVHPEYILSENIPSITKVADINDNFYNERMDRINRFENHIKDSGTTILKFFLHLSKEEQKKRLLRRLNTPEKNWKFSEGDLEERKLWDKYQEYYEDTIKKTSTTYAPWFIIPADDKPTARYLVAKILYAEMKKCNFQEPRLSKDSIEKLEFFKKQLNNK